MAFRRGYALFAMIASVAAILLNSYYHDASFGSKPVTLNIKDSKLVFSRDTANGYTPHLVSHSNKPEIDFARGLGFVHTLDRYTQMLMQKLSGQARLSEAFGTEQLREIDEFLHGVDFTNSLDESIANLSDEVKQYLEAYADGVNYAREQKRKLVPDVEGLGKFELLRKLIRSFAPKSLHEPIGDFLGKNWEFFLADYDDTEPWTIRDSLVIYKLLGYVGLADTQIYTEKIVYRAIHDGVPVEKLKIIFPNLSGITDEIVDLIKKMDVSNLDSFGMPPLEFVPHFAASNNWVVHGSKTISGKPFQCNDPHLLINRLPSVWHEVVLETDNNYWMGIMLPGLPALIMGRTKDLSFGLTYGFLDQIDVWMEEIKDGQYRQSDGTFAPLKERSVVVKHKDSPTPTKLVFYSTSNGQILRKSHKAEAGVPKDGIYMSEKWVVDKISDQSIRAFFPLPSPKSVSEYKKLLKHGAISANLLLSDRAGNIGYQQVGIFPVRPKHWNGFYAGIGWKEEYQWESISEPEFLLSYDNPPEGYISTANNYIESPGHPDSINLHMGFARRNRANSILASISETRKLTKDDMKRMQADVYSTEAENFLSRLAEFVPKHEVLASSKTIERLLKWDRVYTVGSKEATLFDTIVQELLIRTFGEVFGQVSWKNLRYKTGLLDFFHPYLDNVLLNDESLHAFSPKYQNLEDLMVQVLTDIAVGKDLDKDVKEWGKVHDLTLKNVFFAGKLPKFFAADAGPFPFPGTRDTLNQAARSPKTYDENERDDMFGPSWRYVTDMSQNEAETCLPGGINGNLFSSLYDNHLADFFAYKYHKIRPTF